MKDNVRICKQAVAAADTVLGRFISCNHAMGYVLWSRGGDLVDLT
jgi:hypothetical protein